MQEILAKAAGRLADRILRGVGQVMLQDNAFTGALFLLGIFVNSWVFGLYALLGTVVATASAALFGAPRDDLDRGLYGFNGTLTALALALYLRQDALLVGYVVFAAAFSSVVMAALQGLIGRRGSALTAPFVVTSWIFLGAVFVFPGLDGAVALAAPHLAAASGRVAAGIGAASFARGILNGVAQVMFQRNAWTGAIFLAALAANSRVACAAAALGSAAATGIACGLGAGTGAVASGLYGFNAVLTAIAVGAVFFALGRATVLLALLAVAVTTLLYGAAVVVLGPLGLPALTAPFVLATWLCLAARGPLARLREPPQAEAEAGRAVFREP